MFRHRVRSPARHARLTPDSLHVREDALQLSSRSQRSSMTRDRQYIETFMGRLGEAWSADPDSRFGQLTSNISRRANKSSARFDGLEEVSDLAFMHALDQRKREIAKASEESKRNPRPPDAVFSALMYRTKVDYDRWALKEFGRIGRNPARILHRAME